MANVLSGTTNAPVGEQDGSGNRTPVAVAAPHQGDPPRKASAPHPRTVENYGHQSVRGDAPTKATYRNGIKIS